MKHCSFSVQKAACVGCPFSIHAEKVFGCSDPISLPVAAPGVATHGAHAGLINRALKEFLILCCNLSFVDS